MSTVRAEMSSFLPVQGLETLSACSVCHSSIVAQMDPECNLCRCSECGYVFDSPRPGQDAITAFYSQAGKYDSWLTEARARDSLWKRRLKMALRFCVSGSLLDIGAGIGQFLQHARPHFTEVAGTEISESAVRIAKQKYGLEVQHGQVEDLRFGDASFDNVTLFHVLEHVPDPARLVQCCYRLLRPKGVLIIAVPNDVLGLGSQIKKLGKRMRLGPFEKFSRVAGIPKAGTSREIHLSHFTPAVLRSLAARNGFEIVKEGLDPYYAASGLWQAVHGAYFLAHQALFFLSGRNRYETIWLVARKRESQR